MFSEWNQVPKRIEFVPKIIDIRFKLWRLKLTRILNCEIMKEKAIFFSVQRSDYRIVTITFKQFLSNYWPQFLAKNSNFFFVTFSEESALSGCNIRHHEIIHILGRKNVIFSFLHFGKACEMDNLEWTRVIYDQKTSRQASSIKHPASMTSFGWYSWNIFFEGFRDSTANWKCQNPITEWKKVQIFIMKS